MSDWLYMLSNLRSIPPINQVAVVLINFIVLALQVMVFNHNRFKNKQNQSFFLMGVFMVLWVDFAYLARLFGYYPQTSEIFLRVAWTATPWLFYATFLTSTYLMQEGINKIINYTLFLITAVSSFLTAFSDLVIKGITFTGNTLDIIYGIGFYPFILGVFVTMIITIYPLVRRRPSQKVVAFMIGVLSFYVANFIFNIALPAFLDVTHLYYFGDYSTIILLSFTTYAILQHELFEVKVIATEFLTILIWSILFVQIFIAQTTVEIVINIIAFLFMLLFGQLLIKSVMREVKQREQLEELTNKLKHMDNVKNEFISVAAHELRAPLTAIKGYLSMVIDGDAGSISKQAKEFLQDSLLSNERMIRLVNNMLDVGRIEEGRIIYQEDYVKISELAKIAYAEFKLEAERKNLTLELVIQEGVVDEVFVDRDRLHEVIINFLSNALKYTDEGKVTIKLSNPNKNTVKLEVIDTGPGISQHEQKKLFNKFYRIRSDVGKTIGSGLGLYISKLLIQKFGGNIGVESKPGRGSDFWFELPIKINKSDTGNL